MYLKGIAIASHPPVIVPEVGRGEEEKALNTMRGMKALALKVAEAKPRTIVCITPHGPVFRDGVCVLYETRLSGDLSDFGAPGVRIDKACDMGLLDELHDRFNDEGCQSIFLNQKTAATYDVTPALDHGCLVPLSYIEKDHPDFKVVHITIGMLSLYELYRMGRIIREAIEVNEKDAVILASADLSHCLKDEGPYHYNAKGPVFDKRLIADLKEQNYYDILTMPAALYEPAGQCGLRPIVMALGAVDSICTKSQVFSYEGPFGVGYLSCWITYDLSEEDPTQEGLLIRFEKDRDTEHQKRLATRDPMVALAMATIDTWVKEGRHLDPEAFLVDFEPSPVRDRMLSEAAGVFVTIEKSGELRGCIGTIAAVTPSIAQEISRNAIEAVTYDPRFMPVEKPELNQLSVTVSILGKPEDVNNKSELDPKRYGVIAEKGLRRGLLLPGLTGIDTVEEQIAAVKRKAGIPEYESDDELGERLVLQRFTTEIHNA
ncbi:MAG: AmmeMemoRadiSam system protein A [Eubacteriaceae bacterium]|nr:AmmeMemoRadiSam system protein A [Eubacteriaceae bacterium]